MNFLEKLILSKATKAQLEQKAEGFFTGRFEISGGRIVMPVDNKETYIQAYNDNDIIYSIINFILDKVRLPYWNLNKVINEKALHDYNRLMATKDLNGKDYKKALQLKKEALEPYTTFNLQLGKLNNLLDYPNSEETFEDFITFGSLYKLLTGDVYMWGELLGKGANQGIPNEIWNLPSQHLRIKITNDFPALPGAYEWTAINENFTPEEILHERYPNPNWGINGEQLYGFSPLRPFRANIIRNNAAKIASASKFQNGGVEQLIYINSDSKDVEAKVRSQQADLIKQKLVSPEFRGPGAQGKTAVSALPMGSVKLGDSVVEMGIIDSEKWDAIMFCNGYGVPPELLGLVAKTFNNVKEAEKALTSRSALPLLTSRRNSLNRKILSDWGFKGQNVYIDYETECFPELQADQADTATWLNTLILMSPDEQREYLNVDQLNTTESKEQWVKTNSGYVPLSDFQAGQTDQQLQAMINIANGQNNNGQQNGQQPTNGQANGKPVAAN
jgi:phage portal protein BeeE